MCIYIYIVRFLCSRASLLYCLFAYELCYWFVSCYLFACSLYFFLHVLLADQGQLAVRDPPGRAPQIDKYIYVMYV